MSPLPVILKFDESGSWSRASAPASPSSRTGSTSIAKATSGSPTARTTCRAGRPSAGRRAAAAGAGQGHRPPGLQVQPRRQAAAHARQARWQPARPAGRPGVVLPAQRRHYLPEWRHPGRRGPRQRGAGDGAAHRFDKTGKFLREFGKLGTGPQGEFMQPHGLAFDSRGRLFVADRSNNRIQILDAEATRRSTPGTSSAA